MRLVACEGCSCFDASGRYEPNCAPKSIKDLKEEIVRTNNTLEELKRQSAASSSSSDASIQDGDSDTSEVGSVSSVRSGKSTFVADDLSFTQRWSEILLEVASSWYNEVDKSLYYLKIKGLEHVVPGASDLLNYMRLFGPSSRPIITVLEAYHGRNARSVSHRFNLRDPISLARHFDVIKTKGKQVQVFLAIEGVTVHHVAVLGHWLKLSPEIFIRALWRDLLQDWSEELSYLTAPGSSPVASLHVREQFSTTGSGEPGEHFQTFPIDDFSALQHRGEAVREFASITSLTNLDSLALLNIDASIDEISSEDESHNILSKAVESAIYAIGSGSWTSEPLIWKPHGSVENSRRASIDISASICISSVHTTLCGQLGLIFRTSSRWRGPHLLSENSQLLFGHDPFTHNQYPQGSAFRDIEGLLATYAAVGQDHFPMGLCMILIETMTVSAASSNLLYLANHNLHILRQKIRISTEVDADPALDIVNSRHRSQTAILSSLRIAVERIESRLQMSSYILSSHRNSFSMAHLRQGLLEVESVLSELADALSSHREKTHRKLQIELLQTQITESRRALSQQDTIARLTMLAFVFIPTSCVTGIFSMQITEWPTGTPLWVFGLTLGFVLTLSLMLAFASSLNHLANLLLARISKHLPTRRQ